jgi:hypothetical protein
MPPPNSFQDPADLLQQLRAAGITVPPWGRIRASELARYLGVTPQTLRNWRASGKPPEATRLNGQWFYTLDAVSEFLKGDEGR